jgi:hypothetical protein
MALLLPYYHRPVDQAGEVASRWRGVPSLAQVLSSYRLLASREKSISFLLVLALTCLSASAVADDAYLQLLDAEATKVEPETTDTEVSDAAGDREPAAREMSGLASREQFEALLRQENVGTYSFYRKLPERSREEIFVDYRNGASMEALRGKVVNRYLNP